MRYTIEGIWVYYWAFWVNWLLVSSAWYRRKSNGGRQVRQGGSTERQHDLMPVAFENRVKSSIARLFLLVL
jgi:hypothetical protein